MFRRIDRPQPTPPPQAATRTRTVEEELAAWRAYQRRSAAQTDDLRAEREKNDALWSRSRR